MKIAIIGAGASGMMAAIAAAKNGAQVTLIEKNDRVGKKILATGNGKCNFTNKSMCADDFNSQYQNIYNDYISRFDNKEVISFFQNLGMLIKDRNGYCYPRSEQAITILDLLRLQLKQYNIKVLTNIYPVSIQKKKKDFEIKFNNDEKVFFHRVILSCGSFAGEKKRNEFSGYDYAKSLGHTLIPIVPALVQLRCAKQDFKSVSGVRCDAHIKLYIDNILTKEEFGELQLTDYGLSGIPIFQLSRFASYGIYDKKEIFTMIDFLPEYDLQTWLSCGEEKWNSIDKNYTLEEYFQGFLNKKLNLFFIKNAGFKAETSLKKLSFSDIKKILIAMKQWKVVITGTNPYENAQVCAGGVSFKDVTEHLESKIVPGLYFAGEILDVDGRCGGYNLQWAWTSGYLAGNYASQI